MKETFYWQIDQKFKSDIVFSISYKVPVSSNFSSDTNVFFLWELLTFIFEIYLFVDVIFIFSNLFDFLCCNSFVEWNFYTFLIW